MSKSIVLFYFLLLASGILPSREKNKENQSPNIIIILADDLDYGDLSCYQPNSKIKTVHLDRLAPLRDSRSAIARQADLRHQFKAFIYRHHVRATGAYPFLERKPETGLGV